MRRRLLFVICVAAITAIAAWWLSPGTSRQANTPFSPEAMPVRPAAAVAAGPAPADDSVTANTAPIATDVDATRADPSGTFRIDASGKLIIDEQTRLGMEALFARTDRADLAAVQQEITLSLPPAAAAQATALLDRYDNYSQAQRQAYPPGIAPATEEAALAELDGLHALRVAHFGPEIAQALYGSEEALTRSLIELMRLEKDQSLSMEEKAARAQQLYDTLPELSRPQRTH